VAHDFAAVLQLAAEGFRGPGTIYFPGHSADMNAGSHIPPDYQDLYSGRLSVLEEILRHHARSAWYEPRHLLKSSAGKSVLLGVQQEAVAPQVTGDPLARCEMWNAENRQSKYIINSVRAYEFVGSRWRTLWDYEFMDFFLCVPTELRYGQKLFLECLRRRVFVDDLAALAEIPVAKHGDLRALTSVRPVPRPSTMFGRVQNAVKRGARWQALKRKLANPLSGKEDPYIRTIIELCGVEAANGSATLGESLDRAGLLDRLEPAIQESLSPWLAMRVDSVPGFAIYTTVVLAEMSRAD
jgi:hypothetical protein